MVKKSYASIMEIQEGNMVPYDKQLDVKGIEVLTKSSSPITTRKALQKILLEDILRAPAIDQLKFIKDIAILEKEIEKSLKNGNKEYYKPVTIKAMSSYDDPLRIQGIKASIAWNMIKSSDLPAINLDERNAVDIAKVNINKLNADIIKDKYPEIYRNIVNTLNDNTFGGSITAIAIPIDTLPPEWLYDFIDYRTILTDNIGGFPYESIGIQRMEKDKVNYTNIVKL